MGQASSRGHEASPQSGLSVGCKRCSSSKKLRGLSVRAQARRIGVLSHSLLRFFFFLVPVWFKTWVYEGLYTISALPDRKSPLGRMPDAEYARVQEKVDGVLVLVNTQGPAPKYIKYVDPVPA